jgi:hypothetical protein
MAMATSAATRTPVGPPLERFLDAFQVPDTVLRLLAEDVCRVQPAVVGLLARSLTVCHYEWQALVQPGGFLGPADIDRLLPVLGQVETLILHPWDEVDRGPLYDWLSPLFVDLTLHLARVLTRDVATDCPAAREAVRHCLARCIASLRLQAPYPELFQEQLREALIEPRKLDLLLVINAFDKGLRAEFNAAYLQYLASLPNGNPQLGAERLRDFLANNALLYWHKVVEHCDKGPGPADVVSLAAEVIPPVFNAISDCCSYEPIELVPRLLHTLGCCPWVRDRRFATA